MIEDDHGAQDARIARNMEWMHEFLQSILADPDILDEIPEGAGVFLLPDDDPELAEANLKGAERSRQRGYPVYVRRMPSRQAAANGQQDAARERLPEHVGTQRSVMALEGSE